MTTAETARLLGISTTTANHAMQLLVQRNVLERRQRKGTTVALPSGPSSQLPLRCVHLLANRRHQETEGLLDDGRVIGIQSVLPGVDIRHHFLPEGDEAAGIDRLTRAVLRSREREGFVMVRASLLAQRALAASGLPVVLAGTPYPSIRGLAWVDRDHRQVGRLLATYLLGRGVRRVAVLMRDRMQQGDHLVLDAVRDTLAQAGLPLDALTLRCLPPDAEAAAAEIGLLLDAQHDPTGLLCRGKPLADASQAAVAARSFRPGKQPVIAACDLFGPNPAYPHARMVFNPQEFGARVGRLLACQARGERPDPGHEIIPVELAQPAPTANKS